jgi:hypothetical protein
MMPWIVATTSSFRHEVSSVVGFGGSSSSIFVHATLKSFLPS